MMDNFDEESQHTNKNYVSNQLRTNQIRNKKSNLPQDREHLYAENFELKSRVKQLMELNTKLRTQLSINQKEKVNLVNIAEEELFHPKLANRSQTGHKKSVTNIINQPQPNIQSLFNNPLHKQKQNIAFKKIVRDQNIQLEKLNNEIQRLKKTIKYTRMNEILAENNELLNQTLRLKDIIAEQRENQNRVYNDYASQIDQLRKKLNQEKDSEKRNGFQLKKQLQINSELKEKLGDMESKKIDMQKRLNKDLKQYRNEIAELKSKLFEQNNKVSKQCQKQQCAKIKKERIDLKKKNQSYQKELKILKDEIEEKSRQILQKDSQLKKAFEVGSVSKTPEKKQKIKSISKNQINKNAQLESKVTEKKDQSKVIEKKDENKAFLLGQQSKSKQKPESSLTPKVNLKIQQNKIQENKIVPEKSVKVTPQKVKEPEEKKKVPQKLVSKQNQSMDTEKLLESFQQEKPNLKIQSSSVVNKQKEVKNEKKLDNKQKIVQQSKKKFAESDGQYQNLNYDEQFQDQDKNKDAHKVEKVQKKKKGHKKAQKEKEEKQKHKPQNQEKAKKQAKNHQQKSNKKLANPKNHEQDEEILYSAEKQRESKEPQADKQQLKLIRDTLIYKFMAQNYSFDNFCQDINGSEMKEFTITDIMNLLSGQPFLLHEEQIEVVIIYLFDTVQPTGQESFSAKEFIKKMKKFIGKAKPVNEQQQTNNIEHLSQIIIGDEQGEQKMRVKFGQLDAGDGSITVEQFKKVMGSFKVKDSLLQTAISQITYVSQDLYHLNYNFFLKRFSEAQS